MDEKEIKALIEKRRRQIIIHSCIYYVYGKALITDTQFDKWAYELVDLQKKYPNIGGDWAFEFRGFDGTTGFHLNLHNEWVMGKAQILIEYAEKNGLLL
ncbi:DNA ligase LigA-related protein [Tissierella praeacuta]|uniref:DNA ligase LigA-related protein n=1 Tax=Tissierella praeacuta TaxID=43131 RepID=UPI003DA2E4E2